MIKSFKCKETEKIWNEEFSKKLPQDIQKRALQKLRMLHIASVLDDLKIPPSNRLEVLMVTGKGNILFALMTSLEYVSGGWIIILLMLK